MIRRKKNIITAHKDDATNMVSGASFNQLKQSCHCVCSFFYTDGKEVKLNQALASTNLKLSEKVDLLCNLVLILSFDSDINQTVGV